MCIRDSINSLGEGFLISNLRSTYVSLYLEFTKKSVYDDFKMELSHSGEMCIRDSSSPILHPVQNSISNIR